MTNISWVRKNIRKECTSPTEMHGLRMETPSQMQVVEIRDESLSETDQEETNRLLREYRDDSDWTPG